MEIKIAHLQKSYRGKPVLTDVCLQAAGGQCIGILGANGSGKSTLLSILAGILRPDSGSVECDGKNLLTDAAQRASLVGYVPQGTPLIEELSAWDNLRLWYDRKSLEQELDHGILKLLGIDAFLKTPVSKLSGGMKKRLSIGCAVASRPPILLLDEPTAALDLNCKAQIARWLQRYKDAGGFVLLTTHDVAELGLCDACYILKNGVLQSYCYDGNLEHLVELL